MKNLSLLFVAAAFLALPLACKSSKSSSVADVPCTCGTPMGDLEGCAHASCMAGKNNPDNPKCVCGKLDIPNAK